MSYKNNQSSIIPNNLKKAGTIPQRKTKSQASYSPTRLGPTMCGQFPTNFQPIFNYARIPIHQSCNPLACCSSRAIPGQNPCNPIGKLLRFFQRSVYRGVSERRPSIIQYAFLNQLSSAFSFNNHSTVPQLSFNSLIYSSFLFSLIFYVFFWDFFGEMKQGRDIVLEEGESLPVVEIIGILQRSSDTSS